MRVLAVTAHSDLPETKMFIGLKQAGVNLEVMCPDDAPHRQKLIDGGVNVHSLRLKGRIDRHGTMEIRKRLVSGQFHILHAFNNKAVSNGLRASKVWRSSSSPIVVSKRMFQFSILHRGQPIYTPVSTKSSALRTRFAATW
ncbi:MAG: hypothetical protein OEU36_08720 [Gammaproteobacteria bacterium]|nr:hypothetical protein [Gammaproteobacteria bacterium]